METPSSGNASTTQENAHKPPAAATAKTPKCGLEITAARRALSADLSITQRHRVGRHRVEADLRFSAAWTGLRKGHGSMVEVLLEAASDCGTAHHVEADGRYAACACVCGSLLNGASSRSMINRVHVETPERADTVRPSSPPRCWQKLGQHPAGGST